MSLLKRAQALIWGSESTEVEPSMDAPAADIDMEAFGELMEQLSGDRVADPAVVERLWPSVGARGQELLLADATMGPKLRALGVPSEHTPTLDQAAAQASTSEHAEEPGWAEWAAEGAGDLLDGVVGSSWDPSAHPVLEQLRETSDAAWDTGMDLASDWGLVERASPEIGSKTQSPKASPAAPVGPNVVLRPGNTMYTGRAMTRDLAVRIDAPIQVEVVETVQEAKEIATSGAREAGFIDKYHVRSTDPDGPAIDHWVGFGSLTLDSELSEGFVATETIPVQDLGRRDRGVARIWNEKGAFIDRMRGSIPRAVAVAVMKAESDGMGFSGAGDMVIRFENHKLWRTGEGISKSWGQDNPELFSNHFRPARGATEHEFNEAGADAGGEWTRFHGSQTLEWQALDLAVRVSGDPEAAYCAISMGAGQVMGFNATKLGYASAQEMFEAMRSDAEANVGGIFAFIETNPEAKTALENNDFVAFAAQYNGHRYAADYGRVIGDAVAVFERLDAEYLSGAT